MDSSGESNNELSQSQLMDLKIEAAEKKIQEIYEKMDHYEEKLRKVVPKEEEKEKVSIDSLLTDNSIVKKFTFK